jgi:hypothetical protein
VSGYLYILARRRHGTIYRFGEGLAVFSDAAVFMGPGPFACLQGRRSGHASPG